MVPFNNDTVINYSAIRPVLHRQAKKIEVTLISVISTTFIFKEQNTLLFYTFKGQPQTGAQQMAS